MGLRRTLAVAGPPVDATGTTKIQRLLIANRGEIACRVIATCKKLNIASIAVYTNEDWDSLHVQEADEAYCLGSIEGSNGNPHIDIELLVRTAIETRADAVHPGYGYLSENSEFAQRVQAANITFVGPSSYAISMLGDKRQAKTFLMQHAPSVPLIPGFNGKAQDPAVLEAEAERVGFPILIKAAAGGGGRGMRIVYERSTFKDELNRAQSEAQRSFGSSDCLLEKYIQRGKHVEVQILGDCSGDVISLFERECSIQRRHQKIIEEAPCLWLSQDMRDQMIKAAIAIGKLLHYESAGTVEFIVDVQARSFYFLEVNTRIQVEHAITEEIAGVDIVALQIYVASGARLADCAALTGISVRGHAIECRLCAENPEKGFAPDSGLILRWTPGTEFLAPHDRDNVRIETAIRTGSKISVHFDSMIAKIVVWAPDRSTAIANMVQVLRSTQCIGIKSNHLFLQACLLLPGFQKVDYSTNFIPDNLDILLQNPHMKSLKNIQGKLSFLPSLYWRDIASALNDAYRPFGGVRNNFRNQVFDTVNSATDVVSLRSSQVDADNDDTRYLVSWLFERGTPKNTFKCRILSVPASPSPIPIAADPDTADNETANPGSLIARHFTATRHLLDSPNPPNAQATTISVRQTTNHLSHHASDNTHTWTTATLDLEFDSRRLTTHITADRDKNKSSDRVFVCLPQLGTAFEYRRQTMLSYGESLRSTFAAATSAGAALRVYRSSMPCKVLQVKKKEGDEVKEGEVMLVVESMKMETAIVAAAGGVFRPLVEQGEAVDADVVLCELV